MLFPKPFAVDILDSGTVGRAVVRSETQDVALGVLGAYGPVYRPSAYGTCGPTATGAQNRTAIQAAIDAANASGVFSTVLLPGGVLDIDKASSADPGDLSNDYCLRAKSNVQIVGYGTTLRIANNQLVTTPSLRQLTLFSLSTNGTSDTLTNFSVKGLTCDGNAANQSGYTTYSQLGATMAFRCTPGVAPATDEVVTDLSFEDIVCKDFFGNPANLGGGSSEFIERVTERNITCYRCGEGWQRIRCRYVWVENITYIDDNPNTLEGVGTGFVTVGDPHEFASCEDVSGVGINAYAIGTVGSGINSGGGSGLDLYRSVRVKMSQINVYWNNGIETGFPTDGCNDVNLSQIQLRCPTLNSVSSTTIGIDVCPGLVLSDVEIEGYGYPLRLLPGTRTVTGTSADVTASNLTITGGGLSGALVFVNSGTKLRLVNPQFVTSESAVRGVQVQRDASGVDADTRLEIVGGRIAVPGAAIFVTGGGTTFEPKGFITGLDASDSNASAWPFVNQNSGTFNEITIENVQPKQATTNGTYYAGAEIVIAGASQTALVNGSKNQRLLLRVADVGDPYSPAGTFNFGSTSAVTASRINMSPYLLLQPFENGAGVFLWRDNSKVYNEQGRIYPVHQNRYGILSFEAPITLSTTYNASPTNYRMPAYGRIQSYRVRFSNLSAARTAGTITVVGKINGSTLSGSTLTIDGTNTTGHTVTKSARLGDKFVTDDLLRFEVTVDGSFTNSGGATDLIIEMAYET